MKNKKAMTKDDVNLLIQLVQEQPVLTSKETNASTNKLKEEAWSNLTEYYNSLNGKIPRNKEQLKIKWDNLKKSARKRARTIRLSQLESGSENEYIPPNDILETVAAMLGTSRFDTSIGADGNSQDSNTSLELGIDQATAEICIVEEEPQNEEEAQERPTSIEIPLIEEYPVRKKAKMGKKSVNDGRKQRNMAIAEYFKEKTKKVIKEQEKLQLEIDLLKQLKHKNNKRT